MATLKTQYENYRKENPNSELTYDEWLIHMVSSIPSFCLLEGMNRFNSDTFIDNVCLSYRHDFGLMAEQDKQRLRFECKEWMRAITNNWEYFKNGL